MHKDSDLLFADAYKVGPSKTKNTVYDPGKENMNAFYYGVTFQNKKPSKIVWPDCQTPRRRSRGRGVSTKQFT